MSNWLDVLFVLGWCNQDQDTFARSGERRREVCLVGRSFLHWEASQSQTLSDRVSLTQKWNVLGFSCGRSNSLSKHLNTMHRSIINCV